MQVYRAYFKIIKKHIVSLLIYLAVFVFISVIISNALSGQQGSAFALTKSKIAFFNNDQDSPLTDGLKDMLSRNAEVVNPEDNTQDIQDALFFGQIAYVIRIPDGFTQSFLSGKDNITIQRTAGTASASGINLDLLINKYFNTAALYIKNVPGITQAQVVKNVQKDLTVAASVELNTFNKSSDSNNLSYYFLIFAYSVLAILLMGITTIMMAFNQRDLSNRNNCSPLSTLNFNFQLVLGNATFAFAVWAILCAFTFLMYGHIVFNPGIVLLCVNALVFTIVSLSLAFLVGKFIKSNGAQAAITNVLSLGISFISGVFVEQALLGKTVLTIASFTPGYWYVKAVNDIQNMVSYSAQNITPVIYSILIQLGFAAAFLIIAMVVSKQKRAGNTI